MKFGKMTCFFAAVFLAGALAGAALPARRAVAEGGAAEAFEEAVLVMKNGASVRTNADQSGLRFTALMDKADYAALSALEGVTFGMLICPYDYIEVFGPLTAESVFGENAVYAAESGGEGVRIMCVTAPAMVEEDERTMAFNGAIVNLLTENIDREFFGVGFVSLTDESGTRYKFAAENDNRRSAAYVAQRALSSGDSYSEEQRAVFRGYMERNPRQETEYAVRCFLETENGYVLDKSERFSARIGDTAAAEPPVYEGYAPHEKMSVLSAPVYANGRTALDLYYVKEGNAGVSFVADRSGGNVFDTRALYGEVLSVNGVPVTENEGRIELSAEEIALAESNAAGEEWEFVTSARSYSIEVQAYDKIITRFEELELLNENPAGKYLLGADVYGEGASFRVTEEFIGVFDGGGHAICDADVGKGLFKTVGMGGRICNLRLKDVYADSAALAYETYGSIENVVAESGNADCVIGSAGEGARVSGVFALLGSGACFVEEIAEGGAVSLSDFVGVFGAYTGGADAFAENCRPCGTLADACGIVRDAGWDWLASSGTRVEFFGEYVVTL